MKQKCLFVLTLSIAVYSAFGQNPSVFSQDVDHSVSGSVDSGNMFLRAAGELTPILATYNNDGSISVCSATDTTAYIYEYSADLRHIRTMRFQNEFSKLGAFAKDDQGCYYFFYGQSVSEGEFNRNNTALVKYDSNGRVSNILRLPAQTTDEIWAKGYSGIRDPFHSGACRMEISGDMVAVYFARRMFVASDGLNHQASYGFILNKNNFERLTTANSTMRMPSAGHSFNQFILPINNGFIFADQGDAGPRSFVFAKVQAGRATKKLEAFRFKEGQQHYNYTFSQLGGLAKTSDGYIFSGTYEKNNIASGNHNDARNLLILTFDDELNSISNPLWITNYTNKETQNAANPKIAELNNGRYLLMWELMGNKGYVSTYMAIIDKTGRILTAAREMPGVRLNINDVLRYNRTNGNVYWVVDNDDKNIDVFSFNPDNPINVSVRTGAPGGGHGLSLGSFIVNKALVSQHELFTVQATIINSSLNTFSGGQVGAALVNNNGDIVEVIGSVNIGTFNPGHRYDDRPVNCIVPDTVAPGPYRLRMAVRPTGGEWRIATQTSNGIPNAINIAVTAGLANGGGYGMGLLGLTASKTTVSQNEKFDLGYGFINVGMEAFNGQVGAALTDNNNNIVTVLGSWNTGNYVVGARNSNPVSRTCTIPNTVAPGRYRLRIVVRPMGGEWRIATISVENSPTGIDFTVR